MAPVAAAWPAGGGPEGGAGPALGGGPEGGPEGARAAFQSDHRSPDERASDTPIACRVTTENTSRKSFNGFRSI